MAKAQKGELRQKRKGMGRDKDTDRARDKDTDTDTGCWHVPGLWESNGQTWGKGAAKHLQHTGTQPGQPSPCSSAFRLEQGSFVSSPFEPGVFRCPTLSRTASAGCLQQGSWTKLPCHRALPREAAGRSQRRNCSFAGDRNQNQPENSLSRGVALLKRWEGERAGGCGSRHKSGQGGHPCP